MIFSNQLEWQILNLILEGNETGEICRKLKISLRKLRECIFTLKKCGIKIKYSRSKDLYSAEYPNRDFILNLNPFEFFTLLTAMMTLKDNSQKVKQSRGKLQKILHGDYNHFMDNEAESEVYIQVSKLLKTVIDDRLDVFRKIYKDDV